MNIKDRNQQSSTWFRNTVVTAVMCLIPTGMASAQDFDAVQRRLLGGVKAGELSAEQAKIMMAALKKSLATKNKKDLKRPETKDGKQADTKQRYQQAVEEIEQAVKVGKISKQDAQEKISAIKKELFGGKKDLKRPETKDGKQADTKQRYQQAVEEIEQAVKTGKISKQDAREKINQLRKELFSKGK
ncbi:MAG: hypothetical protein CL681_19385 [Blastopirellula sp.]|nr:hypothetical protein [Blastopirellula sp.]